MTPNDFAGFRERVWSDTALQSQLLEVKDRVAFLERVVELGHQHGYRFSREDVELELNSNMREWIERGVR